MTKTRMRVFDIGMAMFAGVIAFICVLAFIGMGLDSFVMADFHSDVIWNLQIWLLTEQHGLGIAIVGALVASNIAAIGSYHLMSTN